MALSAGPNITGQARPILECSEAQRASSLGSAPSCTCHPGDPGFPQTMLFAVVSLNKELYSHWHGPVDPRNVRQLYNGQHAGSAGTL